MAGKKVEELSGAERDRWFSRTTEGIEEARRRAISVGREVWNHGTRTGQQVIARTERELEELGRSELARRALAKGREVGMQADAAVRGAADVVSFGLADEAAALAETVGGAGKGSFRQRYHQNHAAQEARDQYDREHRAAARAAGQVAGEVAAYTGGAGAGRAWSQGLKPRAKGTLGEVLSAGKSVLKGERPFGFQGTQKLAAGGYTRVDHATRRGIVEAKFGPTARLSPRQRQAQAEFGDRYRVDRWLPKHVGRITGFGAVSAVAPFRDDD